MKIKLSSLMVLLFCFASCQLKEKKNIDLVTYSESCKSCYPADIDSLHLQTLYDSARWVIFTWQCDFPYRPKADTLVNKTFGELLLSFDHLIMKGDTIEFRFKYIDSNKTIGSYAVRDFIELVTGVGYTSVSHEKIYVSSPNGFNWHTDDPNSRYINPLQPNVIDYIKRNKAKLNPWFREEAVRRKVISP
jgi:hypothetical protein